MAVHLPPSLKLPEKFQLKFQQQCSVSSDAMSTPSTPSTPCTPPTEPYEIHPITTEDRSSLLDFLYRFFFRDEPLNTYLKLLEDENSHHMDLEKYCLKEFDSGLSSKAVSASGNWIGVCLNGILERGKQEEEFDCKCEKFKKIVDLLDTVDRKADVFGLYPDADRMLTVKILSVDSSWRGRGIAQELINRAREIAAEQCCKVLRIDCTSHFSARAAKRLGFECIYSLNYEDYKVNGETVFRPDKPHTAITIYTQRL